MRILTRHVASAFLVRAAAAAGAALAVGALAGAVEEANRADNATPVGLRLLAALARAPETLFFAFPVVGLIATLWTARDLVPPATAEGLEGAGVRPSRIDRAMAAGAAVLLVAAVLLGGWLAPLAQRWASSDAPSAWARSGGAPAWTGRARVWIRRDATLARVETEGGIPRVTRTIPLAGGARSDPPDGPAAAGPCGATAPSAAEIEMLATPPAWMTFADLLVAGSVRRSLGHLPAPVDAEIALRAAVIALFVPWLVAGGALRRMRRAGPRWAWTAALVLASLAGLQAGTVWAARGEIAVAWVVAAPVALAAVVAWLARLSAARERSRPVAFSRAR